MKTRDKEALKYVLNSGHWRLEEDGSITTRRDRQGRVTDPEVWRPCEFLSTGNRSSTRKRIWVNGQRVYSARVAYTLHNGAPPQDGMQVDHEDDDALNNRGSNLQLLDCYGNIHKETKNGKIKWFEPYTGEGPVILGVDCASSDSDYTVSTRADGSWECLKTEKNEPIDWRISLARETGDILRRVREWWRDDVIGFIKGQY